MHFAVHEFEAWLLADPKVFPAEVQSALPGLSPEQVNSARPPSQRLRQIYESKMGRSYRKTVDGVRLFSKLDPDVAATKCPYLAKMLEDLLSLSRQAGM